MSSGVAYESGGTSLKEITEGSVMELRADGTALP
jgi:hypothetical protein